MDFQKEDVLIVIANTVREMYMQRGYTQIEEKGEQLFAVDGDNNKVVAIIKIFDNLKKPQFNIYYPLLESLKVNRIILICEKISQNVSEILSEFEQTKNIVFETHKPKELKINITKHVYYSRHEVLSFEESEMFKKTCNLKDLPIILKTDPVSKFFAFSKGDIIRVRVKNVVDPTLPCEIIFRIVR